MQVPWYIYIIAIVVAMPCYALWALGVYGMIRALLSWVAGEPATLAPKQATGKR